MTQNEAVLDYLSRFHSITALDAFQVLNIQRLSARIFELRKQGHEIETVYVSKVNSYGNTATFARYTLRG